MVDGKVGPTVPGALKGQQVKDTEPHDLELTVRLDGANAKITATLDVRPLYEWTGPIAGLSLRFSWGTSPPGAISLSSSNANSLVSELKAKRL
jgi:hypothetical protein